MGKDIEPLEIENQPTQKSFFSKYKYYIILIPVVLLIITAILLVVLIPFNNDKVVTTIKPQPVTTIKVTTESPTNTTESLETTKESLTTSKEASTTTKESLTTTKEASTTTKEASTTTTETSTTSTISLPQDAFGRIDCFPWLKRNITEAECQKNPDCIFDQINPAYPPCYYDSKSNQLSADNKIETPLGESYTITRKSRSTKNIKIDFEYLDEHVLRFKIYQEVSNSDDEKEYEVPIPVNKPNVKALDRAYDVQINQAQNEFSFQIIRKSTKKILWDTRVGPIIYEKLKKQISTKLPSKNVYGLGENKHESFKHDLNYKNWPVFARDQKVDDDDHPECNLYGTQPFYTVMEDDGNSHGVVLVTSNAFDYEFIPLPALTYRVTGGVLDFYMFLGPHPENVVQQYTSYFGRTFMPPYWGLGFQISRYGYENLQEMKDVLKRFQDNEIPLDTQVADIDHYDKRKDFTIDPVNWKGLPEYFDELHSLGMKTVMILDPALVVDDPEYYWPYETGLDKDVFIRWPTDDTPDYNYTNSSIMLGYCWPEGKVAYPDFFKESTKKWWIESIQKHYETLKFDGIWIDMNEPAVFGTNEDKPFNWPEGKPEWSLKCPDDEYENIKIKASYLYSNDKKENKLSDKTLCMIGMQGEKNEYKHFDVHNMYGYTESIPSFEASKLITGTRGYVITRSTFIGSGQYGGHWTGDNNSRWSNLKHSIISMLEFNLFGIPYVGADICGFFENSTPELCARWSSLGAFSPFSRNHNSEKNIPQDPGAFGGDVVSAARKALNIRYEILPYYYTLFYKAHLKGNTVARPLFHEFPMDSNTYDIDEQFLIGPAFLVSPVLREGETTVKAYFSHDLWYDYHTGKVEYNNEEKGDWKVLKAELDEIPLHVRSGYIIPTQAPANTTEYSRKNPLGLIVALNNQNEAAGDLFYDDGVSEDLTKNYFLATFMARDNKLKMSIEHNDFTESSTLKFDKVRILAKDDLSSNWKFTLDGNVLDSANIELNKNQVILKNLNIPMNKEFTLEWIKFDPSKEHPVIDCSIQRNDITKEKCEAKGCVFSDSGDDTPICYIPPNRGGYSLVSTDSDETYTLTKNDDLDLFGKTDLKNLEFKVIHGEVMKTKKATRIKITNKEQARYEVPIKVNFDESSEKYLDVSLSNNDNKQLNFEVKNQKGDVLFDTKKTENGFIFCDQFIQIVINLGYKNVYGFGENTHRSFKHEYSYDNWWGLFGRDQPTGGKGNNLYGVHPFFMAVNPDNGRAFGVLILNSNAQEYGFIPHNSLSYRALGGILDIFVMEESSPEEVIQTYNLLIGLPYFPPYWSLGFQLSKYGYNNLDNMKNALDRTTNAGIPIDVQYADIDHFRDNLDFTYDKVNFNGLPEYIENVQSKGMKFIIILDPAINSEEPNYAPYSEGVTADVYIKWNDDENPQKDELGGNNPYVLGYVWPLGKTAFPDFFKDKTKEWWSQQISDHYKNTLKFDGLWIDMNEPANFDTNKEKPWNWPKNKTAWNLICPTNKYDDPPYVPIIATQYSNETRISDKTICMRNLQGQNDEFIHYDVHNLYGWSQSEPTLNALRKLLNKRSIVISRSTYPSSGHVAGHWLGDNNALWDHMKYNIIGMLEFNLFGIPYIGADICGFFSDATPEMCTRWMQLGAFNTFFRNHNGFSGIDQDPAALGTMVAAASKKIVEVRYLILPYLYSLFYQVNQNGGTVIRSLMQEFPTDMRAHEIDRQFMWGSSFLISPVIEKNKRTVYAYFPKARWFDFYTGVEVAQTGRMHELDAPLDHLPLHIRGGSIIVTQDPAINTHESRKNPYGLIITPDQDSVKSTTELFIDEGDEINYIQKSTIIEFTYIKNSAKNEHKISTNVKKSDYVLENTNLLQTIRLFGVEEANNLVVTVDGNDHKDFTYNQLTKVLFLSNLNINLVLKPTLEISINKA